MTAKEVGSNITALQQGDYDIEIEVGLLLEYDLEGQRLIFHRANTSAHSSDAIV